MARRCSVLLLFIAAIAWPLSLAAQEPVSLRIAHAGPAPFSGRVFLAISKKPIGAGVFAQNWFGPEPFFAQDVKNWPANEDLSFRPSASFPAPLTELKPGTYDVQLILDRDLGGQNPLTSPGNLF